MVRLTSAAVAVFFSAAPVYGQFVAAVDATTSDTATINVLGVGEVLVAPVRAVVFVSIMAEDASPETAAMTNADLRSKVIDALSAAGFGADRVTLWGYGAGPGNPRGRAPGPSAGAESVFESKSGVRVIVEPISRLDEVVSVVLLAGAEGVPLVQFEVGGASTARREAAALAVANARVAAEAIAEAAGGRLGGLRSITSFPDYSALTSANRFFAGGIVGQGVQLVPSSVNVTTQVQVSWVFVPR